MTARSDYLVYELNTIPPGVSVKGAWRDAARSRVSANVWYLGATSMLTDISSEMVTSILPAYLFLHVGMSPLAFGSADGVYQGAAAIARTVSGITADRRRQHKLVAALGYALSAASKLGLLLVGTGWSRLVAMLAVDRLGKGIRTSPRDALISLSAAREHLGIAFGVHRALDAAGAMLGPIVAFSLLALLPRRFDLVFLSSFWIAVVGLALMSLFVHEAPEPESHAPASGSRVTTILQLMTVPRFRTMLAAATVLSLGTVSDALLYLTLQQRAGLDAAMLPLLYVGTPFCYFLLAGPVGALADRVGRGTTFVIGHVTLLALYAVLWFPNSAHVGPLLCVSLLGAYYAATDGVLPAAASGVLPADARGTGLGILATGTGLARLCASVVFGFVWTLSGTRTALVLFGMLLCLGMMVGGRHLNAPGTGAAMSSR